MGQWTLTTLNFWTPQITSRTCVRSFRSSPLVAGKFTAHTSGVVVPHMQIHTPCLKPHRCIQFSLQLRTSGCTNVGTYIQDMRCLFSWCNSDYGIRTQVRKPRWLTAGLHLEVKECVQTHAHTHTQSMCSQQATSVSSTHPKYTPSKAPAHTSPPCVIV